MKSAKLCILLIAIILPAFAFAQDDDLHDSIALKEVQVLAKRPLATVQSLKGEELQALSSTSVADALKYFAGVQIKDYGGLGGLKTINVRSLGAQHVGIYIDGIRVTNAQNGTVDLGKFSLTTMESVELFNANKLDYCQSASEYASGATVYLRTRRPTSDSLSVQVRNASFGTYMAKVNAQLEHKGWSGFVDAEWLTTKGDYPFRYKSQYEDTIGHRKNSDIDYYRIEGALFKGGFASHIYYYDSERGCPGGIVRRLSDKYTNVGREWDRDFFYQMSYQWEWGKHRFKANGKYTSENLRYCTDYPENQNTAKVDNHYRQKDGYGAFCYAWTPLKWLSLNTSYDVRYSLLHADLKYFDAVHRLDQKEVVSAQLNWNDIQLAASMLHQHYHDFTKVHTGAADPLDRWTPSITLGYTLYGVTLRAWYKKIFRAPTLNDLYYTQVGNRNLKPEYTKQLNIGVEWNPSLNLSGGNLNFHFQADVYQNKVEDRIVCLPLKGTYTWSMMNYGYTFCQGLNATGNIRYKINNWNFSLLTSLTWQRDLNRTDPENEDTYNKPICYSPTLSYGITGIVGWKGVSLTVSDLHVSERMWSYADPEDILKPYNNIDLKLTAPIPVKILGSRNRLGLSLEVNDLLDEQYEHIPRYPMPGRNYRLTATFTL
ncbi:MAG: TonB-dependent receptor [Bacteroidaceae bacterium]|nr:TonB-dependent receptor [Bacteroidaceae bacterium]